MSSGPVPQCHSARRAARSAALLLAVLCAAPALADQGRMSAAEFEAYATGKTLTYALGGQIFGTEEYLDGRRVRWAFTEDQCRTGHWYEANDLICFVYEGDDSAPQCWAFWQEPGGLRAQYEGDPAGTELSEVRGADQPLHCPGPDVGA